MQIVDSGSICKMAANFTKHFVFKSLKLYQNVWKLSRCPVRNAVSGLLSFRGPFCAQTRSFRSSFAQYGIDEFFPAHVLDTNEPLAEEIRSGRSWRAAELRQKSNEDLHKLWYILLKERNMLLTVQWEARRQEVVMPSPERLHKVKKSMAMIKVVIGERTRAIQDIERQSKENLDFDNKYVETVEAGR